MFCRVMFVLVALFSFVPRVAADGAQSVELTNDEHVKIPATFYAAERSLPPVVLIVADEANGGADAWASFAHEIVADGSAVLVVSPREIESAARVPADNLVAVVPSLSDIRAGIRYLREREDLDGVRVAMIGSGLGARAAMFYGVDDLLLSGICLLSPVDPDGGSDALDDAVRDFGGRAVLVVAAAGDAPAAASAGAVSALELPGVRVERPAGRVHGRALLDGFEARATVLAWLGEIFGQP